MKLRLCLFISVLYITSKAQNTDPFTSRIYGGWGYNAEWYTSSDIKISQPSLGNKYQFRNVVGNENPGWNFQLFKKPLTVPQYNYRLGWFFKKHKTWGFELNFDHTKYQMTIGQDAHLVGTVDNRHIDTNLIINDGVFHWKLNNGANFFCFNIMKRFYIAGTKNGKFKLFNIYKLGAGPVIPHVENTLFGMQNDARFQLGGFNVGFEANYRLEICDYFYVDIAQKIDYARYFDLIVYKGRASQAFGCYEVMATAGFVIPYKPFWAKKKTESNQPPTTPAN